MKVEFRKSAVKSTRVRGAGMLESAGERVIGVTPLSYVNKCNGEWTTMLLSNQVHYNAGKKECVRNHFSVTLTEADIRRMLVSLKREGFDFSSIDTDAEVA